MLQMLLFNMCEGWKKNWHHFGLFLSLFSTFHLNFLQLCKKLPSYISGTHQLLFPLVNNGQKWCQKLCNIFSSLHLLQGECGQYCVIIMYAQSRGRSKLLTSPVLPIPISANSIRILQGCKKDPRFYTKAKCQLYILTNFFNILFFLRRLKK